MREPRGAQGSGPRALAQKLFDRCVIGVLRAQNPDNATVEPRQRDEGAKGLRGGLREAPGGVPTGTGAVPTGTGAVPTGTGAVPAGTGGALAADQVGDARRSVEIRRLTHGP